MHPGDDQQPASVMTADGGEYSADLVIGADGAHSTVRAAVDPGFPDAHYAGSCCGAASFDEQAKPAGVALPGADEPSREVYASPYRLVTYLVSGGAGETEVRHRRLNMIWYDPQQRDLPRDMGVLDGEQCRSAAPGRGPRATGWASSRQRTQ